MVSSSAAHRWHMASSAAADAARQRSILARLISAIAPDDGERLAGLLLEEFQTIGRIWSETPEALSRILGPDSAIIALILVARDAALATMGSHMRGAVIDTFCPEIRSYLIASMGSLPDEMLRIFFLDASGRLIADEMLQQGSLRQLALYPRTIFRRALEHNAAGLILVHNHPSGDPAPSADDVETTRRLDQIGRSLDVAIIDHIIVTSSHTHHIVRDERHSGPTAASAAFTLRAPAPPASDLAVALGNARTALHRRLLREQLLGSPELFGDPAWEMLIDLFIHECEGKELSISSLSITPSMPLSSALRLAQKLCDAGLVRRVPDPFDGRRSIIRLEAATSHRLRAYFAEGSD